ncbi:MAG: hypothetical protein R2707_09975 [Acidimicrobiales bacterium]
MDMRRRFTSAALIAVLALAASACGDDADTSTADPGPTVDDASADGEFPPDPAGNTGDDPADPITTATDDDPVVGCPSGPTFPLSALDDVPPVADAPAGVEAAMRTFLDDEEGAFWPQEGWRVLHETATQVLVVHVGDRSTAAATGLSFMTLEADGDAWRWAGASAGGDCPLQFQLDEGLGVVEWVLDPDQPEPGPDDTVVHVLATERACASAQAMGDRLNEPVVLADESQVSITFSVVPPTGYQDCPGNPATAVAVDLGEPLGERRLVDGRDVGIELEDLLVASSPLDR